MMHSESMECKEILRRSHRYFFYLPNFLPQIPNILLGDVRERRYAHSHQKRIDHHTQQVCATLSLLAAALAQAIARVVTRCCRSSFDVIS